MNLSFKNCCYNLEIVHKFHFIPHLAIMMKRIFQWVWIFLASSFRRSKREKETVKLFKKTTTGLFLFACLVFGSGCLDTVTPSKTEKAVAGKGDLGSNTIETANGIPVNRAGFLYVMKKESSSVAGSFMVECNAKYDEGFWEKKHGDAKEHYEKMKESVFNRGHQLRYYEIRAPAELLTLEITNHIQAIFYKLIEIRHSEGII